jgi:hypothetical protein
MGHTLGVSSWFSSVLMYEAVSSPEDRARLGTTLLTHVTSATRAGCVLRGSDQCCYRTFDLISKDKSYSVNYILKWGSGSSTRKPPLLYSIDSRVIGKWCIGMHFESDIKIVFHHILLENYEIYENSPSGQPMCWPGFKMCLSWTQA